MRIQVLKEEKEKTIFRGVRLRADHLSSLILALMLMTLSTNITRIRAEEAYTIDKFLNDAT